MAALRTTSLVRRLFSLHCHLRRPQPVTVRTMSSDITQHRQEVNGVNIHYEKAGSGDHPMLLLPGAIGTSQTDFSPQLERLNREKFTVIAWDPRGHGKSRPPNRDYPKNFFDRDAKDAADLMKALGFHRYSLLGWSDGAITAMIIAAKFSASVNKMIIWGGNSFVSENDVKLYLVTRDISKWSERMRAPMIAVYGEEHFQEIWNLWCDGITWYYKDNNGDICDGELAHITCPTLIVHGQKDALVPQYHPDNLHQKIKGSRLVNWPEGKHNLHLRYPEEFNKLAEEFLLE
ncbi:serine hydrolase BPHL-like [Glandiceps talaboti]